MGSNVNRLWFSLFGMHLLMKGWIPAAISIGSMLFNQLGKNKSQNREAQNNAAAIDVYTADDPEGTVHLHVQEYAAPKTVDPIKAEKRSTVDVKAPGIIPRKSVHEPM